MPVLPDSGRLEETPLPRLLLDLQRAAFSGQLVLSRDHIQKSFLFDRGAPVYAESNLASESLGVRLMDAERLSRADYSRVVDHVRRSGCKEGEALLELGLIDPRGLFLALKEQVRTRLVECFGWGHGAFELDADAAPPAEAHPFRSDVHALIQEGIETRWSAERAIAGLGDRMGAHPSPSERFARIEARLRRDEATEALLARLDGRHTLWRALQEASTSRALAAAWVLAEAGALTWSEAPAEEEKPEPDAPDVEIVIGEARAKRPRQTRAPRHAAAGAHSGEADARAEALRREIEEKYARLDELDLYQVLGVASDADTETLKRAYLVAAKSYHPDALARAALDDETRERATRVFARISRAHSVLSDPARRREYDASLSGDDVQDANRLAQAEQLYLKGEVLLRAGNFRGALEFLRPCVELWPEEAAYQSALGWCLYKKTPPEPESARDHLTHAAELDPDDGVVHFRLGVVLRALGDEEGAVRAQARAHQLERDG